MQINKKPTILLAFANDRDDYLPNIKRERRTLFATLEDRIHTRKSESITIDDLIDECRKHENIVILHYGGHAGADHLLFESETGTTKAKINELVHIIQQQRNLQVVFLNGCATYGQVDTLLKAGVKAVIATNTTINDGTAVQFSTRFYKSLAKGGTLKAAFEDATNLICGQHGFDRNDIGIKRGFDFGDNESKVKLPWGLYPNDETVLNWTLPSKINLKPNKYDSPKNYLPRLIKSAFDSDEKPDTLKNFIINKTKPLRIVIRGEAGMGKSVELKSIAASMSQHGYYPFLLELKNWNNQAIMDYFPDLEKLKENSEKTFLIIDGLDEEDIEEVKKNIFRLTSNFVEINILVSCRTNIYDDTINDFEVIDLLPLTDEQINQYIETNIEFSLDEFRSEIKNNNLNDLLFNPFYLLELTKIFNEDRRLPNTKAKIFELLISKKINLRLKETSTLESKISDYKIHCIEALEKIAFIMQCLNKKVLNDNEVKDILIDSKEIRNLIKSTSGIVIYDIKNKEWRFEHNNFQEYLAAKTLNKMSLKSIQKIISFPKKYEKTKPTWMNTIAMLISMIDRNTSIYNELIDWLFDIEPNIFINFEKERLNRNFREDIFQKIFLNIAKKKRILEAYNIKTEKFSSFVKSRRIFDFLIEQASPNKNENPVFLSLNILSYYPTDINRIQKQQLKSYVSSVLKNNKVNPKFHYRLFTIAYRFNLYNQYELKEFVDLFWYIEDNHGKRGLDFYIAGKKYQDFFFKELLDAYISNNERNISKNEAGGDYFLRKAISQIQSEEAIYYFLEHCLLISNRDHNHIEKDLIKDIFRTIKNYHLSNEIIFKIVLRKGAEVLGSNNYEYYILDYIEELVLLRRNQYKAFKYLFEEYQEIILKPYNLFFLIKITDKNCVNLLASAFASSEISKEQLNSFYCRLINYNKPALVKYLKNIIGENYSFPHYSKPTREIYNPQQDIDNKIYLLTNQNEYFELIKAIFNQNTYLSEENLKSYYKEFSVTQYRERYIILRLLRGLGKGKDVSQSVVISCLKDNWEQEQIDEIFNLVSHTKEILDNDKARNFVKKWIDDNIESVDLTKAWFRENDENRYNIKADKLSTFIRRFNFTHYPKSVYLDLLSTSYFYNTKNVFEFVSEVIDKDSITQRVLENLKTEIEVWSVLREHINYCVENYLFEAKNLILNHIYYEHFDWGSKNQILRAYKNLNGEVEELEDLLEYLEKESLGELITILIDMNSKKVIDFVNNNFFDAKVGKVKNQYAEFAIKFENIEALKYLINEVKKSKKYNDELYFHNYKSLASLEVLLDLYLLHYDTSIIKDEWYRINDRAWQGISSIALFKNQYIDVVNHVKRFIDNLNGGDIETELIKTISNDLEVHLDKLEHEYYLKKSNETNLEEALDYYQLS